MIRLWWVVLLAALCVHGTARGAEGVATTAVAKTVNEFVAAMHEDSFAAFDKLRAGGDLAQWRDVRALMEHYRCITVSGVSIRSVREESGRTVVEVDVIGSGTGRGGSARVSRISPHWTLTLDTSGNAPRLLAAESTESIIARELAAALPRLPDVAAVLARGVDLLRVARQFAYTVADPAYNETGEAAILWATGVAIELGDLKSVAYCHAMHATLLVMRGEPLRGQVAAAEALRIAELSGDADTMVKALFPLGLIAAGTEGPEAAVPYFARAAALLPLVSDARPALQSLRMVAYFESLRGNFAANLVAADTLAREAALANWPEGVTMAHFTLGGVYALIGDEAAAEALYRRIIVDTERQADVALATAARINLAATLTRQGRTAEAEALLRVAVPQIPRLEAWDQPKAYVQLADTALAVRDFDRARELLVRARAAYAASQGGTAPADVLQLESEVAFASGDVDGALNIATRALEAYRSEELPSGIPYASAWPLELIVSRVLRQYGRCDEAAEHLRQAIAIVEAELQEVVADEAGHVSYFEKRLDPYRELIDVLIEQQQIDEAFAVSEAMRARRLRDLTARARLRSRNQRSAVEIAEGAALDDRIAQLNRTLLGARAAEAALVRDELARVRAELAAFELRMSAAHPETVRRPLAAANVSAPSPGTAVIEYVVLPQRTIVFVSRRDEAGRPLLVARSLAVPRERLATATEAFVRAIERLDYSVDDAGATVRKLVFDPLATALHGITHLQLVPSDVLWNVPFDALRNPDGSYLADRFSISYTPALSFQPAAPSGSRRTLLAIANPEVGVVARVGSPALVRLVDAQQEAEAIGALYRDDARVLTGAAATEQAFKKEAPSYSVLHVATHGLLDDRAPLFSALLLAPGGGEDGLLEAREILDRGLSADLIVLSACETGRGRIGQGEGIVGMTWAALGGGASTVVVSQWKAESRSTRALMVDFHRELLAGTGTAEALAKAKRRLKKSPEFAHPFFWASFVAVGAAR